MKQRCRTTRSCWHEAGLYLNRLLIGPAESEVHTVGFGLAKGRGLTAVLGKPSRKKICLRLDFFRAALTPPPPPVFLERFEELF